MPSFVLVGVMLFFVLVYPFAPLAASTDMPAMISSHFQQLEAALNNSQQPLAKVHVLHAQIRDDAVFDIQLDNRTRAQASAPQHLQMGKEDYINSFLLGQRFIRGYKAKINVMAVEPDAAAGQVRSTIMLEETGAVADAAFSRQGDGHDFISRTVCRSVHGQDLQIISSVCETSVSYDQPV